MSDLGTITHLGPQRDVGDCVVTKLSSGGLRIEQADPRVIISADVLFGATWNDLQTHVLRQITCLEHGTVANSTGHPCINHATELMFRIEGVNRTVIYRIGEKVPDLYAYYAEFPD